VLLGVILLNNPSAIAGFINLMLGVFFTVAGGHLIRSTYQKLKAQPQTEKKHVVKTPALQTSFTYASMPVEQQQTTME
jgi:predicted anti-sigma-YlaC factor YlaD